MQPVHLNHKKESQALITIVSEGQPQLNVLILGRSLLSQYAGNE